MTVGELLFSGKATTSFLPLVTTDSHYSLLFRNQNRCETFLCTACLICLRLDAISTQEKFPRFFMRPASNGRNRSRGAVRGIAGDGTWSTDVPTER
ncbi:hypothetical protein DVH24_027566 [Malus domestica]|uniref:Uncharacterized protein n=1 Tax=Malus domestica TaxID=3750 RepID=A0A498H8V4_MALDO|nr:hypothetical protein DVH24_027566 [Malus domestica]